MKTETTVRRPFHETIVEAIQNASDAELHILAKLIKRTNIPKNHDQIIAAWTWRVHEASREEKTLGVLTVLLEQKQEAKENDVKKAEEKRTATISS